MKILETSLLSLSDPERIITSLLCASHDIFYVCQTFQVILSQFAPTLFLVFSFMPCLSAIIFGIWGTVYCVCILYLFKRRICFLHKRVYVYVYLRCELTL